jgi:hypothetical protein
MKAALSLLGLVGSSMAANIPRGGDWGHGGGGYGGGEHGGGGVEWKTLTTQVQTTYTTVCPVTETITKGGTTSYKYYTTTSVVTKKVPTTIYTTVEIPQTKTAVVTYQTTAYEVTSIYQTVRAALLFLSLRCSN